MVPFNQKTDPRPTRPRSDSIAVLKLVGGAEQHFTAPANATLMCVESDSSTVAWMCIDGTTAAVPAASVTTPAATTPIGVKNTYPVWINVVGGTTLVSIISSGTPFISISFYEEHV